MTESRNMAMNEKRNTGAEEKLNLMRRAFMIIPNEKEPPCVVELQLAVRRLQEQVESLQAERFKERMRRANGEMAVMATTPILIYGAALAWMIWVLRHH
jgi:hypothetical protein